VWVLVALTLLTVWRARRDRVPADVLRRGSVLLSVMFAQGAVGYVQYFTKLPPLLVALHIAGATALWITVLRFRLGLAAAIPAPRPTETPGVMSPL
jgi:cytochrome c oxidase assembly protein subunit 15